jgi:hypothetical protein
VTHVVDPGLQLLSTAPLCSSEPPRLADLQDLAGLRPEMLKVSSGHGRQFAGIGQVLLQAHLSRAGSPETVRERKEAESTEHHRADCAMTWEDLEGATLPARAPNTGHMGVSNRPPSQTSPTTSDRLVMICGKERTGLAPPLTSLCHLRPCYRLRALAKLARKRRCVPRSRWTCDNPQTRKQCVPERCKGPPRSRPLIPRDPRKRNTKGSFHSAYLHQHPAVWVQTYKQSCPEMPSQAMLHVPCGQKPNLDQFEPLRKHVRRTSKLDRDRRNPPPGQRQGNIPPVRASLRPTTAATPESPPPTSPLLRNNEQAAVARHLLQTA